MHKDSKEDYDNPLTNSIKLVLTKCCSKNVMFTAVLFCEKSLSIDESTSAQPPRSQLEDLMTNANNIGTVINIMSNIIISIVNTTKSNIKKKRKKKKNSRKR